MLEQLKEFIRQLRAASFYNKAQYGEAAIVTLLAIVEAQQKRLDAQEERLRELSTALNIQLKEKN